MLFKGQNLMQCNTMINDYISKDFSSHLYWLFEKFREKERKKGRSYILNCVQFCQK